MGGLLAGAFPFCGQSICHRFGIEAFKFSFVLDPEIPSRQLADVT